MNAYFMADFKSKYTINTYFFKLLFIWFRYYPLLLILNDWRIISDYGFFYIFGKFSLVNLFSKLQNYFMVSFAFYSIFVLTIFSSVLLKILSKKATPETYFLYSKYILSTIIFLYYIYYIFPNFVFETIFLNSNDFYCTIDNNTDLPIKKCLYSINITKIVLSSILSLMSLILLYRFELFIPNMNIINSNKINCYKFDRINYFKIFSPLLLGMVLYEIYSPISLWIIILKIVIRCAFIFYNFYKLVRLIDFENDLEVFLSAFCSVTSLSDFIFLKEFFSTEKFDKIFLNPISYSLMYSNSYQISKILFSACLSYLIVIFKKKKENKYLTNIFVNLRLDFYCYYNKLMRFIKNLEEDESENLYNFTSKIYFNIKEHSEKCSSEECDCTEALKRFSLFIQNGNNSTENMKNVLKDFSSMMIKNINSHIKTNDQRTLLNKLLIELYYYFYFKRQHIRCVYNIEKLKSYSLLIKNPTLRKRLDVLKYEIITSSILNEKKIINYSGKYKNEDIIKLEADSIKKIYVNFKLFFQFKRLQSEIEDCFKKYKKINQKFYLNEYFMQEFQEDMHNLIISMNIVVLSSQKFNYNLKNITISDIRIISVYYKFFLNEVLNLNLFENKNHNYVKHQDPNLSLQNNLSGWNSNNDFKERLILKINNKQQLMFEKITPNFCFELGYSSKDILYKELDYFIPKVYKQIHDSLIQKFIASNKLNIKEKEIYFISKEGYCINYKLNSAIFLTLDGEILFFCEMDKISDINSNFAQTAFMSCLNDGKILCFDLGVKKHLFIDSYILNLMTLNIFRNFLCLNRQSTEAIINLKNDYEVLSANYLDILNNIKQIDFSKVIDTRNQDYNNEAFIKKISNAMNFCSEGICTIEIFKRSLLNNIIYDVRMDFSKIMKMNNKLNRAIVKFLEEKPSKEVVILSKDEKIIINKEKEFFKLFLKTIKNITVSFLNNQQIILKNFKILGELLEEYYNADNPKKSSELHFGISSFFKENQIEEEKTQKILINFYNRFFLVIIFLGIFVTGYYYLNLFNDELYSKTRNFIDFGCISIILKFYTISLSHSFYSFGLIKSNYEPEKFNFNSKTFDNSFEYHYNLVKERETFFIENSYRFQNLYNKDGSYLLENNDTIYDIFNILELNSNWQSSFKGYSMNQNVFLFHYITDRISLSELKSSKFNYFNYTLNTFATAPSNTDKSLFFYYYNILGKISAGYNKIIEYSEKNFNDYVKGNNIKVLLVYVFSGVFALIYVAYETIQLYKLSNALYTQYFVIYNKIKVFHLSLINKIDLIIDIFNDFTEDAINEIKKNSKLILLKQSESYGFKNNDSSEIKILKKYGNKDNDIQEYYRNLNMNNQRMEFQIDLHTPTSNLTGSHNRLNPINKVNPNIFKVFAKYKNEIAKSKANENNNNKQSTSQNPYLSITNNISKSDYNSNFSITNSDNTSPMINNHDLKKSLFLHPNFKDSKSDLFGNTTKELLKQSINSNVSNPLQSSMASENKLMSLKEFSLELSFKPQTKNDKKSKKKINENKQTIHQTSFAIKKLITHEEFENSDKSHRYYFQKSVKFVFLFRILLFLLVLILVSSFVVFFFVLTAYDNISENFTHSRNVLLRNTYLNELLLIYRASIIKREIIYNNYTDIIENLFERDLKNFQTYFAKTKVFINSIDTNFLYVQELEKNLNTKNMCNYYSYIMTNQNMTTIMEYQMYYDKCNLLGGGINTFGWENSIQSMISVLVKNQIEFSDLINKFNKNEDWTIIIHEKFSDETFQKLYKNILEILFDINQITYEKIFELNDHFYDDLAVKHDWVHYMLFLIISLVNFFYLFMVKYMIDKPKFILEHAEGIVQNSILFNILEI